MSHQPPEPPKDFTPLQKALLIVLVFGTPLGIWYWNHDKQSSAGTTIDLTLKVNPDLNRGLVGHWTFDGPDVDWGSSTAEIKDTSGNNNHGNAMSGMTGAANTTVGAIGQAVYFPELPAPNWQLVNLGNKLHFGTTSDFSLSIWAKTTYTSAPSMNNCAICQYNAGNGNGWMLSIKESICFIGTDSNGVQSLTWCKGPGTNNNAWHHVVAVIDRNNDTWTLYKDGSLIATTTDVFTGSLDLGLNATIAGPTYAYHGSLDDARIYNRALSAEEVKRLYQLGATTRIATTPANPTLDSGLVGHWTFDGPDVDWGSTTAEIKDTSGYNNHGNASSSMTMSKSPTIGVMGQAMRFDGSYDQVVIADAPSLDLVAQGAVSVWVNRTSIDLEGPIFDYYPGIIVKVVSGETSDFQNYSLNYLSSSNRIEFKIGNNSQATSSTLSTSTELPLGSWVHVVGVWDGVNQTVFENGNAVASKLYNFEPAGTNGVLSFGSLRPETGDDGRRPKILLDDVRIYNRALSADEVKRLYELGATTRIATTPANPTLDSGLVAHYTFDGPDVDWGSTTAEIKDTSGKGNHGNATSTMTAAKSPTIGVMGQAMKFDGTNDVINAGHASSLGNLGPMTASYWINSNSTPTGMIFFKGSSVPISLNWSLELSSGVSVFRAAFSGASILQMGLAPVRSGGWHHVALVWDGSINITNVDFYLDGMPMQCTDTSNASGTKSNNDSLNLYTGMTATGDYKFSGTLDDLRIYNRALSANEIKRLYDMGR